MSPPTVDPASVIAARGPNQGVPQSGNERLAAKIPEFGGAFWNKEGAFNVYLTDLSAQSRALPVVQEELRMIRSSAGSIQFLKADYTYNELASYKNTLLPYLGDGVSFYGVDARYNRFRIEVVSGDAEQRMKGNIERVGLSLNAFIIERGEYATILTSTSLTNQVRPLLGGLKVTVSGTHGLQGTGSGGAWYNGSYYYVIASHVADSTLSGTTGSTVYQPTVSGGNAIGVVALNPAFSSSWPGCPTGDVCRESDAALVSLSLGVSVNPGGVADPGGSPTTGGGSGSLSFDDASPTITDYDGIYCNMGCGTNDYPGATASKVGMMTGWTGGNYVIDGTAKGADGKTRLATTVIEGGWLLGDSGAPVLGANTNYYVGVLWGGRIASGTKQFLFSPVSAIGRDLAAAAYSVHFSAPQMLGYEVHWIPGTRLCFESDADNMEYYMIYGWPNTSISGVGYDAATKNYMGRADYYCNTTFYGGGDWQTTGQYATCDAQLTSPCPCAMTWVGHSACIVQDP